MFDLRVISGLGLEICVNGLRAGPVSAKLDASVIAEWRLAVGAAMKADWGWVRLGLRLGGGVVGSVLVATPYSVHSTCIELQLSHVTTAYPHPC